ncbi:hypothetical protein [Flavivirga rizhaonensis]|uniref:Uncharacterized protein n=1 Tax=Flavivirga rizhaonensis TaxID=2559571 RepID=A0A4V3P4M6_9FLAO|nr:hypothetical protein [Flavivirga rizhaonensis]TGV02034.1 hypothetical protein EM932_12690 [Flavivirga rizhaonensis]
MYPEITDIQNFIAARGITIWLGKGISIDKKLIPIVLKIDNGIYNIHVADEYDDLDYYNPILNFIIVFRAIVAINESSDFLEWCKQEDLDPNNYKLLDYYKDICNVISGINLSFPDHEIDYFVSDLDFQLNTGAMQFLRR